MNPLTRARGFAISSCFVVSTTSPCFASAAYRGTSLIRNSPPVGIYSSPMPRDLW